MPADTSARARRERAVQERAQALVAGGALSEAVQLLDAHLARFDGDWGLWLYFAGLCSRSGRREQAVAAYRASSRQLEGDGLYARARAALVCAARLAPRDQDLKRDVERVGRLALLPEAVVAPRAVTPAPQAQQTGLLLPTLRSVAKRSRVRDPFAQLPPMVEPKRRSPAPRPDPFALVVGGPSPRSDPFALLAPAPMQIPQKTRSGRARRLAPLQADPARHLTSVLPDRPKAKRSRRAPSLVEGQTDPHCPIFDILDAERSGDLW